MDIQHEIASYNVSRETKEKITEFVDLLRVWNEKMNLVSKNSMQEVWGRHVLDSMQIIKHIRETDKTIVDMGSGSGFPAIILAILLEEINPSAKVFLVESIAKKTMYLKDVCQNLSLDNAEVLNCRIEDAVFKGVDVITARAVSSLENLLKYSYSFCSAHTRMLFPKGEKFAEEEENAKKYWNYEVVTHPNLYHPDGVILEICNLRKKK